MGQHDDDLICVGHILGSQGLKGWVRVFSNTSPRENIVSYGPWYIEQGKELKVTSVTGRLQGKNVVARLEGIEDRTQADELIGCRIFIKPEQLPSLEAGEYYWSDLVGLSVETLEGDPLGEVASMMETGADDVMVLKGERERLIPFVMDQIVREVDLVNRRLVVDWSPEY
ncbi:MAG: ribosome maturation factor RimM [Gammaproteobacteria bacterium]|nr:ribosome maturation factor RimM [Gammaproteobacteria bacterium]MDH3858405.1 ribosome maturation factor RimM [Gammaproteobacteria bacterium]